jgi:Fic family protein
LDKSELQQKILEFEVNKAIAIGKDIENEIYALDQNQIQTKAKTSAINQNDKEIHQIYREIVEDEINKNLSTRKQVESELVSLSPENVKNKAIKSSVNVSGIALNKI